MYYSPFTSFSRSNLVCISFSNTIEFFLVLNIPRWNKQVAQVRAVVRDAEKTLEMFGSDNALDVAVCDLRDDASVAKACAGNNNNNNLLMPAMIVLHI
jgi:hypothetical protein